MATNAKYKVNNGSSWEEYRFPPAPHTHTKSEISDFSHTHATNEIVPTITKTYTNDGNGYIGIGDNWDTTTWYFMYVRPETWYKPWHIKIKVTTWVPGQPSYYSETWSDLYGRADSMLYHNFNERNTEGHYYIVANRLKVTGFNNGYRHAIGVSIKYASGYTNTNYKRNFKVDYYMCEDCTVTILDTPLTPAGLEACDTTNRINTTVTDSFDAINRGLQESGDSDNYYQILAYFRPKAGGIGIKGVSFIGMLKNGSFASLTSTNTQSTSATALNSPNTTDEFLLSTPIWYYSNNSVVNAGNNSSGNYVSKIYHSIDTRYVSNYYGTSSSANPTKAFNINGNTYSNAYIKIIPNFNNGTFKVDSLVLNETDKNTAGVGYYIFIGRTYSTSYYQITLDAQNPIMYWDGSNWLEINTTVYATKNDLASTNANVQSLGSSKQDKITSDNKLPYSLISGTPSAVTEATVSGWGFTKNTGTYSKPSGGIPKTDLASSVQASLGKADTAIQSLAGYATETYVNTSISNAITNVLNTEV